jgi:hypothetical protein
LWLDGGKSAHGEGGRGTQGDKQNQDIPHGRPSLKVFTSCRGTNMPARASTHSNFSESRRLPLEHTGKVSLMGCR